MEQLRKLIQDEKGEFNYVSILLLLIVAGVGVIAWVYIPPLYANFNLRHFAEGQAIKARETPDDEIRKSIFAEAEKLGIPTGTLNIGLNRHAGEYIIDYNFEYPVKLPGMQGKTVKMSKRIHQKYKDVQHLGDDSHIKKLK